MKALYLDYAAATPVDAAAMTAMQPYIGEYFYNPSAVYQAAREVRQAVETARATVAGVLGAKDQEIVFTAGGTEANNIAIHGVMSQFPNGHIVVSAIEHESILEPVKQYPHTVVPVRANGMIDLEALEAAITEKTVLVSVMYANNEIGTIQPIKEISQIIVTKRAHPSRLAPNALPLYLHTDAAQAANYLDLQVTRLGVDLMTINGGKIYSLKQSGALYVRARTQIAPFISGGGQERNIRSGTENVAALISFATMLQKVQLDRHEESHRLQKIRNSLFAILSQNFPDISLNGDMKKRLPNNLNITIPGVDGERLIMELDEQGVMAATGSACTASNDEPSHVLLALGMSPADASASLRLTLGRPTTEQDGIMAAEIITKVLRAHTRLV